MVNAHRKALERLWKDRCSIFVKEKVTDPTTHLTDFEEKPLLQDQPCKLSFETLTSSSGDPVAAVAQTVKLFLSPDVEIPAGCIFGSNLAGSVQGWRDSLGGWVDSTFGKGEEIMEKLNAEDLHLGRFEYGAAFDMGYEFGQGVEDTVGGLFDFSAMDSLGAADGLDAFNLGNTLDGIYGNTGDTAGNTAAMSDALDIAEEDLAYSSSIDEQTYNKIKLTYDNEQTGKRELYIAQDGEKMNQWGVLQYFEALQNATGAAAKANALLKLYDQKTRKLTVKNAFGDVRVRAGCAVVVALNLGDIITNNYLMVEKVTHNFKGDEHFMDLTLIGGEFIA